MEKTTNTRTERQNSALHLFFTQASEALNDAGMSVKSVVEHQLEIPFSPVLFKELIWRRAQEKYTGKKSTTRISTKDIDQIYDIVNRFLGELGIDHIPFPSIESLMEK